jgi:hypothetical protein
MRSTLLPGLQSSFVAHFTRAIRQEMEAMRERRGSFEVVLTDGQRNVLNEPEGGACYTFRALPPDENLLAGLECTLRASDAEHLVRIDRIDGAEVTLWSERPIAFKEGHVVLVIYSLVSLRETSQGARGSPLFCRAGDGAVRQTRRGLRAPEIDPGARVSTRQAFKLRVETRAGLVENQHRRVPHHCPRDAKPLALTA